MKEITKSQVAGWLIAVCLGLAGGRLLWSDPEAVRDLREALDQAQQELARGQRSVAAHQETAGAGVRERVKLLGPAEKAESADRNGVTLDDISAQREQQQRAQEGYYVLESEFSLTRRVAEQSCKDLAAKRASKNATAYGELFRRLGVSDEVSRQLQHHMAKIDEASLRASSAWSSLLQARHDYDARVRSVLSAGDYATYREYEAGRQAREEVERVASYAQTQGVTLDAGALDAMRRAVQAAEAYTVSNGSGPYEITHVPLLGTDAVLAALQQETGDLQARLPTVLQSAGEVGLSGVYLRVLNEYYAAQLARNERGIEVLKNPPAAPAIGGGSSSQTGTRP